MRDRAKAYLRTVLGPDDDFRDGQWEAISALVHDRDRLLVVQRTGWGKSTVYFTATWLLRQNGAGPSIIVSPLLALMRNQYDAAQQHHLNANFINSTNHDDWPVIREALQQNDVDVLFVSPEQLCSDHFRDDVLPAMPEGPGLLVVDEAHCISDWGHDFRPDYRRIVRVIQQLPSNIPLLGTTATANKRVVADVVEQLGPGLKVQRGPLVRKSLALQTIILADQAERLAWLAEHVSNLPGTGIIYCLTVADCERVAGFLRQKGVDVYPYHARLPGNTEAERTALRVEREQMLLQNRCKALVATVALSMGYDKRDLGFVVHYQRPGSVVAYYQQVGRAGRGVDHAVAVLLNGREDDEIQEYFIEAAFPAVEDTLAVVEVLDRRGEVSVNDVLRAVNLSQAQVEKVLKLLMLDALVAKDGAKYFRTANKLVIDLPAQERVKQLRRSELERMREFVQHKGCLMEFVEQELDDPYAEPCQRCAGCKGDEVPRTVNARLVQEAVTYLQRDHRPILPRRQWPAGGAGDRRGRILEDLRLQEGRALCMWGDAGWGKLVQQGKYRDRWFDDELVDAVVEMIATHWQPLPPNAWITAVPSINHPVLVADFAQRLANKLGLPFIGCLRKVKPTAQQKTLQNSAQQATNALSGFAVTESCRAGPVFVVDDIVDSGWTFTVCGVLLREAGSGPVIPVALAAAAGGGNAD